jgi:starch synthase
MYDRYMHILFVTSEVAGIFKIGGLADVSLSLPLALERSGISVTVTLPFYKKISTSGVRGAGQLAVDFKGKREIVFIFSRPLDHTGGTLLLFRHPLLDDYHAAPIEETFAFYSKVISTFYLYGSHLLEKPVDIVHCHDWHAALVPLLIGEESKVHARKETIQSTKISTIITIHNLLYQGVAGIEVSDYLNAPRSLFHIVRRGTHPRISFLREGLEYADMVTTVSETYAGEIAGRATIGAIGDVLHRRKDKVRGILNGIDTRLWDPASDRALPHTFTPRTVFTVKPRLKGLLQKEVGLPQVPVPVFGFIGRLEPRQKGIEIILEAMDLLFPNQPLQIVILGTGSKKAMETISVYAKKYHRTFAFLPKFDENIARRIYAGSDILLVPSKFEPCGLTQMIAMRYGTVPLVRATGGLLDSVKDGKTGFVFDRYRGITLSQTILRALTAWQNTGDFRGLIKNCMDEDFSWEESAGRYGTLYRSLLRR